MLSHIYSAKGYAAAASELARVLVRHRRWRIGVQAALALAVVVPVVLGVAGVVCPASIYSSALGIAGLIVVEVVGSV